jgi:hypothetical protein
LERNSWRPDDHWGWLRRCDRERNILVDETLDRGARFDGRAGARREEADDKHECYRSNYAGCARDTLIVEASGKADLPAVDGHIKDARAEMSRLAPHALVYGRP